jgi:hypothetical protein
MPIMFATDSQIDEYVGLAEEAGAVVCIGDASVPPGMCMIFHNRRLIRHGAINDLQHMVQPGFVIVVSEEDLQTIEDNQKKRLH